MLTILFCVLMIAVFGRILWFAIQMTWSITKIVVGVILLPLILVVLAAWGLLYIAFPLLLVIGLFSLCRRV